MGANWFGLIFAALGGLFTLLGVWTAITQARKLRTYVPAPATITSSEVAIKSDSDGSTYAPKISYVYHAGGQAREGTAALAIEFSTSNRSWAEKIVRRYPPGKMTQAYVDPLHPEKAFLVHELTVMPYGMVMFSMIFVIIGLGIIIGGGGHAAAVGDWVLLLHDGTRVHSGKSYRAKVREYIERLT